MGLKLPNTERPCAPEQFSHCFHETGLAVTANDDNGPYTHSICCHCAMSAIHDKAGKASFHGRFVPPPTEPTAADAAAPAVPE